MSRRKLAQTVGFAVVLAMGFMLLNAGPSMARAMRMIYIIGGMEGAKMMTSVEPKETSIGKGTTVIWFNQSESEVKISFLKGRECKVSTSAAVGWKVKEDCYVTDYSIPPGGTTSAVFNGIGQYEYEVVYVGKDRKDKGMIKVSTKAGYPM